LAVDRLLRRDKCRGLRAARQPRSWRKGWPPSPLVC
jgi:hypothetical protein